MKLVSRYLLSALFLSAGVLHFLRPAPFIEIVPPYVPAPAVMVSISGMAELIGGLALLTASTRTLACWGLIALLVAVFPANVNMAMHSKSPAGMHIPSALLWFRLLLQPLLIWWVISVKRKNEGRPTLRGRP